MGTPNKKRKPTPGLWSRIMVGLKNNRVRVLLAFLMTIASVLFGVIDKFDKIDKIRDLVRKYWRGDVATHDRVFKKDTTGILILRMGEDASHDLQDAFLAILNGKRRKQKLDAPLDVQTSTKFVNENDGLDLAHNRAREIGRNLNAQLVVWGRKIGANQLFLRITIVVAPKEWPVNLERTRDKPMDITDLRLPAEAVDEPLYLVHFGAGFSFYVRGDYAHALPNFEAALERGRAAEPDELADLRFFAARCHHGLTVGQKAPSGALEKAIELYKLAADAYEKMDRKDDWAKAQNNLGAAYGSLGSDGSTSAHERRDNLEKAIAAFESALRIYTKSERAAEWARTQSNLAAQYNSLATNGDTQSALKSVAACEGALQILTEKDGVEWAATQTNLGVGYVLLPTGDQAQNMGKAIAAFKAAQRIYTEATFQFEWAVTENNLGDTYSALPSGNRIENLQEARVHYMLAIRVFTKEKFPQYHDDVTKSLDKVIKELQGVSSKG
jgi:tetratricopeptide (TPR) repeat protein